MKLEPAMSRSAAAFAAKLARTGKLKHSGSAERPGQGENLAMACNYRGGLSASDAVEMWYVDTRHQ